MDRNFSFKEAKELLDFYRVLLKRLSDGMRYPSTKIVDVKNQFSSLKSSGYFSKLADRELQGLEYKEKEEQFIKLLLHIDSFIRGVDLSNACERLYQINKKDIETRLDLLSSASNPIAWFFTGKNNKEKAISQFKYLKDYKNSVFVSDALNTTKSLRNLSETSKDTLYYDFYNNRQDFHDVVARALSNAFAEKNVSLPAVRTLIDKNNSLAGYLKGVNNGADKAKKDVNDAIKYFVSSELLVLLRSVPIEELNRDKRGIRVKALRDAGYLTMADVYVASPYSIGSIYGISQDVAFTIQRIANEYAKKAMPGIKIKLSVDNKNKASTNVVKALYSVRRIKSVLQPVTEILDKNSSKMHDSFELLKSLGGGAKWPFFVDSQKDRYLEAYSFLKNILYGDLEHAILNAKYNYQNMKSIVDPNMAWSDFAQNSIQYYNLIEEICPGVLGTDDAVYGLPEDLARQIQDECIFPDGLLCTLRRYQEWGVKYILHQEKVLLGDEMGLGKTVQAIATMVSLKNVGATHFVVVCPASVLTNWCREIAKHSLLKVIKVHGYGKIYSFRAWLKMGGVAVTTYESTGVFKFENGFKINQLVVDEAHYIKNPEASRSQRVRELCKYSERILFMTGTALENRVNEMIELVGVLRPNIANRISRIAFMSTAPQFRQEVAPVYYRRKREDVLTELPDLIESEEWCNLTPEEEYLYEDSVLNGSYMSVRRVSWNVDDVRRSSKAQRLLEIIEDAKNDGRKILVFSFFLETIKKIHDLLGYEVCLNPITGSLSSNRRQEIIDEFEAAPAGTVLCAQIQSGGTGLNIQAASVVIICEPQLKPSIENQAISRAYRMGQSRNVQVFRLLSVGTIDEKMINILKEKQAIFDAFADKSVAAEKSVEIDDKTFGDIIKEEIERIKAKNGGEGPRPYNPVDDEETEEQEELSEVVKNDIRPKPKEVNLTPIQNIKYDSSITYSDELKMPYQDLVAHLLAKYGKAKGDYFLTESCRSKNKAIARGNEGLFCHHIDEDKAIMLSTPAFALRNPFSYQKADRLVYCDILEHLILHIKIAEEPKNKDANENEFVGIGGAATFICRQINDCYCGKTLIQPYMLTIQRQIKDKYDDYIMILQRLWNLIKQDPMYSMMFTKEDICSEFDGEVVPKIFNSIN